MKITEADVKLVEKGLAESTIRLKHRDDVTAHDEEVRHEIKVVRALIAFWRRRQ